MIKISLPPAIIIDYGYMIQITVGNLANVNIVKIAVSPCTCLIFCNRYAISSPSGLQPSLEMFILVKKPPPLRNIGNSCRNTYRPGSEKIELGTPAFETHALITKPWRSSKKL